MWPMSAGTYHIALQAYGPLTSENRQFSDLIAQDVGVPQFPNFNWRDSEGTLRSSSYWAAGNSFSAMDSVIFPTTIGTLFFPKSL